MNKYKLTYDSKVFGSDIPERLSYVVEADSFDEAYEFFTDSRWRGDVFIKLELIENE